MAGLQAENLVEGWRRRKKCIYHIKKLGPFNSSRHFHFPCKNVLSIFVSPSFRVCIHDILTRAHLFRSSQWPSPQSAMMLFDPEGIPLPIIAIYTYVPIDSMSISPASRIRSRGSNATHGLILGFFFLPGLTSTKVTKVFFFSSSSVAGTWGDFVIDLNLALRDTSAAVKGQLRF